MSRVNPGVKDGVEFKETVNEKDAHVLSTDQTITCIDPDNNLLVVTDSSGQQQIFRSVVTNEELAQDDAGNYYVLDDSQMITDKDKHLFTNVDGTHLLISARDFTSGVPTEPVSSEHLNNSANLVNLNDANSGSSNKDLDFMTIFTEEMNKITRKLVAVENAIHNVGEEYVRIDGKVNDLYAALVKTGSTAIHNEKFSNVNYANHPELSVASSSHQSTISSVSVAAEAYEDGCWLGDPNNPDKRVRCNLTQLQLEDIHSICKNAEKMAVTLLDYLVDRETQACSNISGNSKNHVKKQLDPLILFGIRCHLEYIFGMNERQWHKIKQNIDSKCRTAFRRKLMGKSVALKTLKISNMCKTDSNTSGSSIYGEEEQVYITGSPKYVGEIDGGLMINHHGNIDSVTLGVINSSVTEEEDTTISSCDESNITSVMGGKRRNHDDERGDELCTAIP